MKESPVKEVFVTYSWDSEDHKLKVLSFFNYLRKKGFHTDIDRKVSQEQSSIDFYKMMHTVMTDYNKVIIVLSKGYKIKADSFSGGVGTEYSLIIKDIDENPKKYVLVSFERINESITPLNFKGREIIDLSNPENEEILFLKLLDIPVFDIDPIALEKPIVSSRKIPDFKFDKKTKNNNPSNSKEPVPKKKEHYNRIRSVVNKLININYSNHYIKIIIISLLLFMTIGYQKLYKRSSEKTEVKEQSSSERNNSSNDPEGIIGGGDFLAGEHLFSCDGGLLKGIVKKNCKILSGPSFDAYDRSVAEKFTVLYMFKHDGTSSHLKNNFYWVGKSSNNATGYVHKDQVAQWNNRLCLAFTDLVEPRPPALVYPTKNLAMECVWDTNKIPNKNAIGLEPITDKDAKYDMLLPVLEELNVNKKGSLSENMRAYKIGFLGESGADRSTIIKPLFKGKPKLDLMILIYATRSMVEEIVGVKQVLRSLINTLKNMENIEVRIGISLLKDNESEFVSRKWQALTTDYSRVLSKLSDIEVSSEGNAEAALYQGILTTIKMTNWSKGEQSPALREILIIGDAPGHHYDGDNKVDANDLIKKASEERIRFITLNVGSNEKLSEQLTVLTDGLKDGDQGLYMEANAYTGSISDDYLSKLSLGIKGEIERLQELEAVTSGVKRLEDITPANRAVFIENLPSSNLGDIGVHYNEGWVTEKNSDGARQVESYVYMTYGDLSKYKFFCQAAIATASAESEDEGMVDLTTDKLTALSGEAYDKETGLDEHLRKTLCLPSSGIGFLKYSLSEIFRWSPERKMKFILTIDAKVKVLDQIIRDNTQWRNPDGTDLKYTFIKISLLP